MAIPFAIDSIFKFNSAPGAVELGKYILLSIRRVMFLDGPSRSVKHMSPLHSARRSYIYISLLYRRLFRFTRPLPNYVRSALSLRTTALRPFLESSGASIRSHRSHILNVAQIGRGALSKFYISDFRSLHRISLYQLRQLGWRNLSWLG